MLDLIAKSCSLTIGVGEGMCGKQFCYLIE
jgi:hypothetical protein